MPQTSKAEVCATGSKQKVGSFVNSLIEVCGKQVRVRGRLIRLASVEGEKYVDVEPAEMIPLIRKCGTRVDLFTFGQNLPETSPKYPYAMEWYNVAALPISTFDAWWSKQVDNKTRNMVRKGERKGVTLREVRFSDELVRGIWEIYNECPVRQGTRYTHYGKDVQTVYREEATFLNRSAFLGAFLDEKMIGFVKLTYDDRRSAAHLINIVSMIQHRDKAPTNALIAEAVRFCAERRIGHLVYAKFAYGKKQRSTLADFKKNNGFERIDLPLYHVPLTPLGRMALRFRLHHRFADRLPQSMVSKLRELRSAWYNRKLHNLEAS